MKKSIIISLILALTISFVYAKKINQATLRKIESRQEITNIIAAYAFAWDGRHAQKFKNYFLKNAIIINSYHGKIINTFHGVQAFINNRMKMEKGENKSGYMGGHNLSQVHFKSLTNTTASTEIIFNYFCYGNKVKVALPSCNIRGAYVDNWVKTNHGWRIKKRRITHENIPPMMNISYK